MSDYTTMSADQWHDALASRAVQFALNDLVVESMQEDYAVLLDFESGEYYGLNSVATTVWKLLRERRSFSEIGHAVTGEYAVAADVARRDIAALLGDLRDRGVLLVTPG
jgi:hypothetical protein